MANDIARWECDGKTGSVTEFGSKYVIYRDGFMGSSKVAELEKKSSSVNEEMKRLSGVIRLNYVLARFVLWNILLYLKVKFLLFRYEKTVFKNFCLFFIMDFLNTLNCI